MTHKNLYPKDKTGVRPRSERKRFLNVIYFIDSNRTRTLKFSIRTSYLTVGTLCLLVSWSFIASLLLVREHNLNTEIRSRSRDLLEHIFSYQTRYDQVYEKAYPNDNRDITSQEVAVIPPKEAVETVELTEEISEAKVELPTQALASKTQALAAKAPMTPAPIPAKIVSPDPKEKIIAKALEKLPTMEPLVAIENFSNSVHEGTLTVRLSLKNTNKGNKATGTVTAQARFIEEGKEAVWIATQVEAGESADAGDQDDPSSDQRYNIRFYKNKVFHFISPSKQTGKFSAVRITIKDEQGRVKEKTYTLTKEPELLQSHQEPTSSSSTSSNTSSSSNDEENEDSSTAQ